LSDCKADPKPDGKPKKRTGNKMTKRESGNVALKKLAELEQRILAEPQFSDTTTERSNAMP